MLVVIAIIGLLASVVLVALNGARIKARDTKRLADMAQIQKALEFYIDSYGQYPGDTNSYGEREIPCGWWDTSGVDNDSDGKPFIEPLIDAGIVSRLPNDPIGTGTCDGYTYRYYRYNVGQYSCDAAKGDYYVLGVVDMEGSSGAHPDSPGWSCSGRDWQTEMEWVTGRFTK